MRLQVALEFMLIFTFVLLVFLFLFTLITNQRAQIISSQSFSELQLVVQNVASQMQTVSQTGAGSSAVVSLGTATALAPFNLTITRNGVVVARERIGTQVVQAIAYSQVPDVQSNSSFLVSPNTYLLPTGNGTLYLQNSFGSLCVDVLCQTNANSSESLSSSVDLAHAATFNGNSSYIEVASVNGLSTQHVTLAFWSKLNGVSPALDEHPVSLFGDQEFTIFTGAGLNTYYFRSGATMLTIGPLDNDWHQFVVSYDGSNAEVYVDGNLVASGAVTVTPADNSLFIGTLGFASSGAFPGKWFNGSVSDVQVYNASLTSANVSALYSEGIGGAPVAGNVLAWYPLAGDAEDYSGNGNGAALYGPVLFTSVAQINAHATNVHGSPVANALVGFETTAGSFYSGSTADAYTNANGLATAFLNQNGNNAQATVKAVLLNGAAQSSSLVAWFPQDLGQGAVSYGLNTPNQNATLVNASSWDGNNYVASFSGTSGYARGTLLAASPSDLSVCVWVDEQAQPGTPVSLGYAPAAFQLYSNEIVWNGAGFPVTYGEGLSLDKAYQLCGTYNGTASSLFVNGVKLSAVPSVGVPPPFNTITIGNITGAMSDVQVYGSGLTATEVLALYGKGQYGAPLLTANTIAWYPLGGDANDYAGVGSNLTLYGSSAFVTAPPRALQNSSSTLTALFNGANSAIATPLQHSSGTLTITFWVDPASESVVTSSVGYAVFNSLGTDNVGFFLANGLSDSGQAGSGDEELSVGGNLYHGFGISGDEFHFVGIVLNNGVASIYTDGSLPYNQSIAAAPYSADNITFGKGAAGMVPFAGELSNVQIYASALTPSNISTIEGGGLYAMPLPYAQLLAWYPLAGSASDSSGNGNNGSAANIAYKAYHSVPTPAPLSGAGVSFNIHNSSEPTNVALGAVTDLTVSAWVDQRAGTTRLGDIASNSRPASTNQGFELGANDSGVAFLAGTGSVSYNAPLTTGDWYNIVARYNGSALTLYEDGVPVSTSPLSGAIVASPEDIEIGNNQLTGTNAFPGSVADVRVYSSALTGAQVYNLYRSGIPPASTQVVPLGWYP